MGLQMIYGWIYTVDVLWLDLQNGIVDDLWLDVCSEQHADAERSLW